MLVRKYIKKNVVEWGKPDNENINIYKHRGNELPTCIWNNGLIEYYQYNKKHRVHGPAYISKLHDNEQWFYRGNLHRTDGPAITFDVSTDTPRYKYYIHGVELTEYEFYNHQIRNAYMNRYISGNKNGSK